MKSTFKKILCVTLIIGVVAALSFGLVACNDPNKDGDDLLFGKELLTLTAQMDTLTQLNQGGADIAVMDSIMAGYYTTRGDFAGRMTMLDMMLSEEDYGIASRKDEKALMGKINEALIALFKNGRMTEIATEYGLQNEIKVTSSTVNPYENATDGSWNSIVGKKKLIIGYTEFAPIAYKENNVLKGYDVDLAKAVVSYLNDTYTAEIEIEFSIISWEQKETQMRNGAIDLIWNGMTITQSLIDTFEISVPYLANKQSCVVMKTDEAKYNSFAAFMKNAKNAIVAVENGSAAHKILTMEI